MSKKLGKTTTAVYQAIIRHKQLAGGDSPTIRELADAVGAASPSSIHYHLTRLEDFGLISRDGGAARGIRVIGAEWLPPQPVPGF